MSFALAPWHMWGTSQLVTVPEPSSDPLTFVQSAQLSRVNYGRPETWSFFFGARLLAAPAALATSCDTIVDFDLILGIGRSSFRFPGFAAGPGFCRLVFSTPAGQQPRLNDILWTSSVLAPVQDQRVVPDPPGPEPRVSLDTFPAEDIQCSARVSVQSANAENEPTIVELYAAFAPRTHIRPEWLTWDEGNETRFRGKEQGGS